MHYKRYAHRAARVVPGHRGGEVPDKSPLSGCQSEGHAGETREQRILEYIEANPRRWVVGLREGCMLHLHDGRLELVGLRPARIFRKGVETFEVKAGDDLGFLL